MHMKKIFFCGAVCFMVMSLFILNNTVSAQVRPSTFSVTPYFGGYVFDKDQKVGNAPVYGINLGYNIIKYFSVEASGEFIATNYDLPVSDSSSTRVGNLRLDGVFNILPDSRLVPFIFAGGGGQSINYPQNVSNRVVASIDCGAGLKFFFTDWLALRGDIRHTYIFDDSRKDFQYTLGLAFHFGGTKRAAARQIEPVAEPEPPAKDKVVILASEPKVEDKVVVAAAEPKIIILAFEDIHFDFDKSTLKPEAQSILKRNVQILKDNPKVKVRIAGYTSALGTEDYNQKLSERRAKSVQEYLINEGVITPGRISTIGYGETHPAMHEAAPKEIYSKAAKANMRVLFEIIVK